MKNFSKNMLTLITLCVAGMSNGGVEYLQVLPTGRGGNTREWRAYAPAQPDCTEIVDLLTKNPEQVTCKIDYKYVSGSLYDQFTISLSDNPYKHPKQIRFNELDLKEIAENPQALHLASEARLLRLVVQALWGDKFAAVKSDTKNLELAKSKIYETFMRGSVREMADRVEHQHLHIIPLPRLVHKYILRA